MIFPVGVSAKDISVNISNSVESNSNISINSSSGDGTKNDLSLITEVANNMVGRTICVLADAAAMPARSYVQKFYSEFEEHVQMKGCPFKR